jgi:hypothetical protein
MPDVSTIAGGPGTEGATPASSRGVQLGASGSANVDGSYATILTNALDTDWLHLSVTGGSAGARFLIDLATDSGAEQEIISDIFHQTPTTNAQIGRSFVMPYRIKAGKVLRGRVRSTAGAAALYVAATTIATPIDAPQTYGRCETVGATPATSRGTIVDCGGTANTDVTVQLSGGIAFDYGWMCVSVGNPDDVTIAAETNTLFDVVQSSDGSNWFPVVEGLSHCKSTLTDLATPGGFSFPCAVREGQRLGIRARCSVNTAGDRSSDYVVYGFG